MSKGNQSQVQGDSPACPYKTRDVIFSLACFREQVDLQIPPVPAGVLSVSSAGERGRQSGTCSPPASFQLCLGPRAVPTHCPSPAPGHSPAGNSSSPPHWPDGEHLTPVGPLSTGLGDCCFGLVIGRSWEDQLSLSGLRIVPEAMGGAHREKGQKDPQEGLFHPLLNSGSSQSSHFTLCSNNRYLKSSLFCCVLSVFALPPRRGRKLCEDRDFDLS